MSSNVALAAMANPVSAHAVLREATGVAHRQLEAVLPLMAPTLTLRAYVQTLERFFDVYEALETQLEDHARSFVAAGLDWPTRRKLPLLRRDLDALGCFHSSAASAAHATPPRLRSFAHALGCAYVLEGATLGGVIIAKHVEAALHLGPENGASFFRAYGPVVRIKVASGGDDAVRLDESLTHPRRSATSRRTPRLQRPIRAVRSSSRA